MKYKQNKGIVDISQKEVTRRTAQAQSVVSLGAKAFKLLMTKGSPKGNVLETAKVAGLMAAKATPQIIPMCHPLELNQVAISYKLNKKRSEIVILSEVVCLGRTGVEMEALTAVSVAALTIYDMMKWADKGIKIKHTQLIFKSGGKSGDFRA